MQKIEWEMPRYRQKETMLIIPDKKDLDQLISATQSKRMAAFLQCLKETFADPGEILKIEWREIKDNIITINNPVKGHLSGQCKISNWPIAMLNRLPKKQQANFPCFLQINRSMLSLIKEKNSSKTAKSPTVKHNIQVV
jgi:integrase